VVEVEGGSDVEGELEVEGGNEVEVESKVVVESKGRVRQGRRQSHRHVTSRSKTVFPAHRCPARHGSRKAGGASDPHAPGQRDPAPD